MLARRENVNEEAQQARMRKIHIVDGFSIWFRGGLFYLLTT